MLCCALLSVLITEHIHARRDLGLYLKFFVSRMCVRSPQALALAVAEVTGRAAETETAAAEKAEKDRLAAIKAAKEAKKAANSNKGGGKKGKKKKSGGGDEASKEEAAEEALPIEASAAVAAGDDGGENDGDGDKVDDASSLDLTQRGALVHQTKKGLTVFHLAAEMPKTKPSEAVVVS
jgi:hypothetical protein